MSVITSGTNIIIQGTNVVVRGGSLESLPNPYINIDPASENYANGASVGQLTDRFGVGFTAIQATAGNKPTFETNVLNGQPAVLFDGTNDVMSISQLTFCKNIAGITLHFVYSTSSSSDQYIIHAATNAWATRLNFVPKLSSNVHFAGRRLDADSAAVFNNGYQITATTAQVASITWDYTTGLISFYHNGLLIATTNDASAGAATSNTDNSTATLIGSAVGATAFFNGRLFQLTGYSTAHSRSNVQTAYRFFKTKFGL